MMNNNIKNSNNQASSSLADATRASFNRCLTNMRTRTVSGTKLARRNEIVSRPPEKIRSTATADPT